MAGSLALSHSTTSGQGTHFTAREEQWEPERLLRNGARQVYSQPTLYSPGTPAQGVVLVSVGWLLLHQQSRLSPNTHAQGATWSK